MTTAEQRKEMREFADHMGSDISVESIQFKLAEMVWTLVDELDAESERADALQAEVMICHGLLEGLTPGGSEFSGWPERCAAWVQERLDTRAKIAAERNALRAKLDAVPGLRESLADVQHAIWSHWMNYMFTQGTYADGAWTMPADKVERWSRQMATPYGALTFKEQESDRHQADKVIAVLMQPVQP